MNRSKHATVFILMLVAALAAAGVASAVPSGTAADSAGVNGSKKLRNAVEPAGILVH